MRYAFNAELLERLGLGHAPAAEQDILIKAMYATLESRVGMGIAAAMTPEQLDAFGRALDEDDDEALAIIDASDADRDAIVAAEYERLCAEVADAASTILEILDEDLSS